MNSSIEAAAQRLREAYIGGAIPPLRDVMGPTDGKTAYAVQLANTRFWRQQGRRVVGRKIGLTASAVQKQLGVDQPDFGVLFDDMAIPNGFALEAERVLQPKIEAEVAVRLGHDLCEPECSLDAVMAAVDTAVAAIEVVDSRIADWKITFADTVADNGSSAYFVLGDDPKKLAGLDLYSCGMVLEVNGQVASIGAGAACLGHPLKAVAWLASTLAKAGDPLRAGDVILTGALGPMVPIKPGDSVEAKIGGLGRATFRLGS